MSFTGIAGHERIIELLRRSLATGKLGHAYLFNGIEGCGKRLTALALVQALFCRESREGDGCGVCPDCRRVAAGQHPDLHFLEPDGAFIKIDQVRALQRELSLRPHEAPRKACIIEAADRLNPSSGNALLKTLEEPPGNALLVLLTANGDGVLPTILSRCVQLHFLSLPEETIAAALRSGGVAPETAAVAASLAQGSMRRAQEICSEESLGNRTELLDRVLSLTPREIAPLFRTAEELGADRERAMEVLDLLLTFFRDLLHFTAGVRDVVNTDLLPRIESEAGRWPLSRISGRIDRVLEARHALQRNVNARLVLEVLFLRLAET